MKQYHKIDSIYKRDERGNFIQGTWANPAFGYLQDNYWEATEKVDGTNIRIMFDGENVTFGGKTDNAQIPAFLVTRLNNLFMTIEKRQLFKEKFPDGVCFYGEGHGAKIQKGGGNYKKDGVDFILFDVKVGEFWLERPTIEDVAQTFGMDVVPVRGNMMIKEAIEYVKLCPPSAWGDFKMEGVVLRPHVQLFDRTGKRIITKIKVKDFIK